MTTIQEHTDISSYSPSDYISGTSSSPLDFPSIHYKDSLRHRSELAKKGRSRATQSYLQKKKRQIDAEERILRKQEERRKNRSDDEDESEDSEEDDQSHSDHSEEGIVDTKTEEKDGDDDNNSRSHHIKSKSGKKSTSASRQGYKSNKSGDESDDRSNKRASRRTRPEDIDLSLPCPTNNDDSSDDSSDNNTAEPEELIQEIEEHFKFKRNLNFKTDDEEGDNGLYVSGKTNATQLTSREWKQVIERRLDAQDKGRKDKDKKSKKGGKGGKHL
ncbi:hypothetical protein BG003_002379 [Podila horticola]|nr:hypothetical protein BG003_002379 [Podila horticola]